MFVGEDLDLDEPDAWPQAAQQALDERRSSDEAGARAMLAWKPPTQSDLYPLWAVQDARAASKAGYQELGTRLGPDVGRAVFQWRIDRTQQEEEEMQHDL